MRSDVLLVDPDVTALAALLQAIGVLAAVSIYSDFMSARAHILSTGCDLLVTNLRLGAFNGLHLAYLAANARYPPRSIVYTLEREPQLAREVQKAAAFYETRDRLPLAIPGYLANDLPPSDRRDPATVDRRQAFRGGRRCSDVPAVALS